MRFALLNFGLNSGSINESVASAFQLKFEKEWFGSWIFWYVSFRVLTCKISLKPRLLKCSWLLALLDSRISFQFVCISFHCPTIFIASGVRVWGLRLASKGETCCISTKWICRREWAEVFVFHLLRISFTNYLIILLHWIYKASSSRCTDWQDCGRWTHVGYGHPKLLVFVRCPHNSNLSSLVWFLGLRIKVHRCRSLGSFNRTESSDWDCLLLMS